MLTWWTIERKKFILKYTWKISRNSSDFKEIFFVRISDGYTEGIGEVAFNIRFGETAELIDLHFQYFLKNVPKHFENKESFFLFLDNLELPNALRFGIESAYIHFFSKQQNETIWQSLALSKVDQVFTSFSIPILDNEKIPGFIKENNLERFKILKVKVNQESGLDTIKTIAACTSQQLIIDANEAWSDVEEFLKFCNKLKAYNILFIEQPLPSRLEDEYVFLKKIAPFQLMADESVSRNVDILKIAKQFHAVNMKLMKAGGYLEGIRILSESRKAGLKTMIGCMVETTLGISNAMHLSSLADYCDLDGFMLLQADPFKLVFEENGILKYNAIF